MSWKKNICSYLLWLMYTVAVTTGIAGFLGGLFDKEGYSKEYCVPIIIVLYLVVGMSVMALRKLSAKHIKSAQEASALRNYAIAEGILMVVLLAGGIFLRTVQIQNIENQSVDIVYNNTFCEAAKVSEEHIIPQVVHGATYIYLQLLHFVFLLFGNKFVAAVWLQVVLQCLLGAVAYFAVRKLSGRFPALIMLGFLMFSPYMINSILTLSPETLFLVIFAVVLFILASTLTNSSSNPIASVLVGVLIGICCYFDLSGVTLLLFAVSVFSVERDKPSGWWNMRGVVFLWNLVGAVLGWFGVIALDAIFCSKKIFSVMTAWSDLYQPRPFSFPVDAFWNLHNQFTEGHGMIVFGIFLIAGIFSFWCRRSREHQGVWTAAAIASLLFYCFGMVLPQMSASIFIFLCLSTLAGIGVGDIFSVSSVSEAVRQNRDENVVDVVANSVEESAKPIELLVEPMEAEKEATGKPKSIHFLENPLPLPKKHETKVLDYRIVEVGINDFDYAVDEDDDFDI